MTVLKVNIAFDSESEANTKMASRGQHDFLAVVSFLWETQPQVSFSVKKMCQFSNLWSLLESERRIIEVMLIGYTLTYFPLVSKHGVSLVSQSASHLTREVQFDHPILPMSTNMKDYRTMQNEGPKLLPGTPSSLKNKTKQCFNRNTINRGDFLCPRLVWKYL